MNTLVRMSAEPTRTRVLITQGPTDIGKVVLPLSSNPHPRAMATLLEGLSLFLNERLCVVLCVDESSSSCGSVGLLDALGYGERNQFYEVAVAVRASRASRRGGGSLLHLAGGGDFRDLRQLTLERAQ
jgi:hypothetical protein